MSKKKKNKVIGRTALVKSLNNLNYVVAKECESSVKGLMLDAEKETRDYFRNAANDPLFTQRYGVGMSEEIAAVRMSGKSWALIAPAKTKTYQMAENMYFAEYGAGKTTPNPASNWVKNVGEPIVIEDAKNNVKRYLPNNDASAPKWVYKTTSADKNPRKYWVTTKNCQQLIGVTDYSKPIGYMAHARRWLRNNGAEYMSKRVQTTLYRYKKRGSTTQSEGEGEE